VAGPPELNMSIWSKRLNIILAVLGMTIATSVFAQEPQVIRKGEGQFRKNCDKLELKPFDTTNWAKLSEWTNGPALTPGDYNGKVVLIVSWADWYPPSVRAMNAAKRLAEKHAKDGLVVVAAHNAQGWKEAKKPAASDKDAAFLIAFDAKGEFRSAVGGDQDPSMSVIDRAGQMRYCNITSESVEPAVEFLLKEKMDEAAGMNAKLAAEAAAKDAERRRTDALRHSIDLTGLPEVPFTMPQPEAYKEVRWPRMPRDPNAPPEDPKNPDPPIIMNIPDVGFYPSKPPMTGRAVLMYFWHPEILDSYQEVMPWMDQLQRQHSRDLVVIGVVCPLKGPNGQELKVENDPERIQKRLEEFRKNYKLEHTLLVDLSGTLLGTASKNNQNIPIPWGAIVSSDNTLRWGGWLAISQARGALDKVLANDPGVNARRKAEEEYIRAKANK
jgi:thiol-disulfide isomerase/thioredoxin